MRWEGSSFIIKCEARNKAAEIIQSNRETHKLIAEALLKYETLILN